MKIQRFYDRLVAIDPDLPYLLVNIFQQCKGENCECKQDVDSIASFMEHIQDLRQSSQKALDDSMQSVINNPNIQLLKTGCANGTFTETNFTETTFKERTKRPQTLERIPVINID